jgi:hypothetical protein
MGLGASIVIFAIGAILKWGVTATATGLNLGAIGVILMVVGAVGALISALFLASWSPYTRRRVVRDTYADGTDAPVQTRTREVREF